MAAHSSIPQKVQKDTRAVLLSSVKGVALRRFCKDYHALVHEPFPWKSLGFGSPVELLRAMPDSVRFEFCEKDGEYRLYGIGNGHCYMPSWFIKAQGNPARSWSPHPPAPPLPMKVDPPPSKFGYNSQGLVTIYVSWKEVGSTPDRFSQLSEKEILAKRVMLTDMMGRAGNPVEVYVHPSGYAFVRFQTLQEADAALRLYHGAKHHGLRFSIKPATESTQTVKKQKMKVGGNTRSGRSYHTAARKQSYGQTKIGPPIRSPELGRKHVNHHLSHDSGRWSCDLDHKFQDPTDRRLKPPRSEDGSSTSSRSWPEAWSPTGSDSSLEWDDSLLDDHTAVPLARDLNPFQDVTVPIPFQNPTPNSPSIIGAMDMSAQCKFPGIDADTLEAILSACSGAGSWYQRFASVCGSAPVVVTEVVSACHFWARIDDKSGGQATIEKCLTFLMASEEQLETGSVCAAFLQRENAWKRCWYQATVGVSVGRVFLLDEGRWEHVPLENLTSLPPFICHQPMLAVPCVLSGLEMDTWSPESLQSGARYLRRMVEGVPLTARLMLRRTEKARDPIPVILDHEGPDSSTSINAAILSTGLVTLSHNPCSDAGSMVGHTGGGAMRVPVTERLQHRVGPSSLRPLSRAGGVATGLSGFSVPNKVGLSRAGGVATGLSGFSVPNEVGLTPVTVRQVESPDLIWLQMTSDPEGDLERVSRRIEELRPQRTTEVRPGSFVSVKAPEQPQNRRSQVKQVREFGQMTAVWIDTGTTYRITSEQLYALPREVAIAALPPLAIPCRLHGLSSTLGTGWNPMDNQLLWKHLFRVKVYAKFVKSPSSSPLPPAEGSQTARLGAVELFFDADGYESVAEMMVKEGYSVDFQRKDTCAATAGRLNGTILTASHPGAEANSRTPQSLSPWKRLQNSLVWDSGH